MYIFRVTQEAMYAKSSPIYAIALQRMKIPRAKLDQVFGGIDIVVCIHKLE